MIREVMREPSAHDYEKGREEKGGVLVHWNECWNDWD